MPKPTKVESRDYLDMTDDRPLDTFRESLAFRHLLSGMVVPPKAVLELFGGAGVFRTELGRHFPHFRGLHVSWDHSLKCVEALREKFPASDVRCVDSFTYPIPRAMWSLISADFNTWTFLKYKNRKDYADVTARIFLAGADFVQLTDSAVNKLHLNWRAYAREFGVEAERMSPADYICELGDHFAEFYGYSLVSAAYHTGASYLLFMRGRGKTLSRSEVRCINERP